MIAQIEVFSEEEAIQLGLYLDQNGYRWNGHNGSTFFEHYDWDRWLPHKYYFIGLFNKPNRIFHEDVPFELKNGERYDFDGTFTQFMEFVGMQSSDDNDNYELEDESELEKLLFA